MMKKAIIIGAGPAGLTAAYQLLIQTDIQPVILEATHEIGGISRTVCFEGNRMDIGGHRFFSKNDEIMSFWKEIMPLQGAPAWDDALLGNSKEYAVGGPDPEKEDRVMLIRRRVSRILYLRKFFDYPISMKFETFRNMGMCRTVYAGCGYLWAMLFKCREDSLKDFMVNRFGTPLYRMFFEKYTEKVWGRSPEAISASWGAQRIKGLSLWKALSSIVQKAFAGGKVDRKQIEISLIDEFIYPKKGPGQLWETLAEDIRKLGGEIIMGAEVTGVRLEEGRIAGVTALAGGAGKEFSADYYFSSMPVKDLVAAMGRERVPGDVYGIASTLPYRDFITVGVLVDKLKLDNRTAIRTVNNIVPDCWIYIQEADVKIGRLQIFNNWSPYMVADPANKVWVGLEYFCNEGDELWEMNDSDFRRFAAGELEKIGVVEAADVLSSVRVRVKKAYPAYFDSYEKFGRVREFLDTLDNLYCIGRNGQHRYNTMDHSMLSAMEAVKCVQGKSGKKNIWAINADDEYHEAK